MGIGHVCSPQAPKLGTLPCEAHSLIFSLFSSHFPSCSLFSLCMVGLDWWPPLAIDPHAPHHQNQKVPYLGSSLSSLLSTMVIENYRSGAPNSRLILSCLLPLMWSFVRAKEPYDQILYIKEANLDPWSNSNHLEGEIENSPISMESGTFRRNLGRSRMFQTTGVVKTWSPRREGPKCTLLASPVTANQ